MLKISLAFCAGTAAVQLLPSVGAPPAAAIPALAAACALRRAPHIAALLAGCAVALHGAASAIERAWPCLRDRDPVALEGTVLAPALARPDRTDFDLAADAAPGAFNRRQRIRLSWYEADALPGAGERWRFRAKLRCPRGFANPGAPDRELALLREGISATGYLSAEQAPERVSRASGGVQSLRERVAASITQALAPGPSAAVLQGLAVGLRGNIPDNLWEALGATGLAHLVAISGLHVTGCALAALVLLRTAWRWRLLPGTRWRPTSEALAIVAVTAAYAILAGGSLPALRTVAMVALFHGLRALRRSVTPAESLALAAAVLLAADPLAVTSAGFWLSFVATAALLAVGPAGKGWLGQARQFVRAQAAVTVLLLPVLATTFGRVSLISPFVNALAIPAFSLAILPAVLLGTAMALVDADAPAAIWRAVANVLDAVWPQLERMAGWPATSFAPASQPAALVAGAAALALVALIVPVAGLRIAACVAIVTLVSGRGAPILQDGFTVTVMDVGQGLAAVVETSGHVLVFDAGPRWRGGAAAARVSLLPFLRARGVRRIDTLVLSHDDADHHGGAQYLVQAFDVGSVVAPPGVRGGSESCIAGGAWQWDGIDFGLLHPPAGFQGSDNDSSCALHVRGPGGSALLLADPETGAEPALAGQPVAADMVLVPHHGSATSSSPPLVAAVSARLGIVSAGFGNRWDMPRREVVSRWRQAGTTVLRTDRDGAVQVRFHARGAPIGIEAERRDVPRWWRTRSAR